GITPVRRRSIRAAPGGRSGRGRVSVTPRQLLDPPRAPRAHVSSTPPPRARARAAPRARRAAPRSRGRGPRSARAGPARRALPPCRDRSAAGVSARSQLCNALRTGTEAEQRSVELAQETGAIAVEQGCDEQAADELRSRRPEALHELGALLRRLAEQGGGAHCRRPDPLAAPQRRVERLPQLLAPERVVLEEGKLPAVERVAETRVVVRAREMRAELLGHRRAERIEARRLAGRSGGGDRAHRP